MKVVIQLPEGWHARLVDMPKVPELGRQEDVLYLKIEPKPKSAAIDAEVAA